MKFDVVIIEDDPYWYLQYPSANGSSKTEAATSNRPASRKSSGYAFLDSLVPSYLSVDYQGRVVRLDTFSKTVAPGCRLGWITTQPALCERLLRITETSTQRMSPQDPYSSTYLLMFANYHSTNDNANIVTSPQNPPDSSNP